MTGIARTMRTRRRAWWRRHGRKATLAWAVAYAVFGLVCARRGTPLFAHGGARTSAPGCVVTAVGTSAALACVAVMRYGLRPLPRALLWVACGAAGIAAFGLLMDVITLMFGQGVDSRAASAEHALAAAGALLLAATARSDRRQPGAPGAAGPPPPSAASRPVHLTAFAGTVVFLPYATMKLTWALGGTFAGMSGAEARAISQRNGASGIWLTLESWGLDATVLLALLGVFLLWGLVRPWGQVFPTWSLFLRGRRVPRWLPLAPALVGAATLVPYGVVGVGYLTLASAGVVTMRRGDFPSSHDALLVAWIGIPAFAVYGIALTIAAHSYWRRVRPVRQAGSEAP